MYGGWCLLSDDIAGYEAAVISLTPIGSKYLNYDNNQ